MIPDEIKGDFETLGLPANASLSQVKAAFRDAAKRWHPDCGGDAWQFARITEAYERLCEFCDSRPSPESDTRQIESCSTSSEERGSRQASKRSSNPAKNNSGAFSTSQALSRDAVIRNCFWICISSSLIATAFSAFGAWVLVWSRGNPIPDSAYIASGADLRGILLGSFFGAIGSIVPAIAFGITSWIVGTNAGNWAILGAILGFIVGSFAGDMSASFEGAVVGAILGGVMGHGHKCWMSVHVHSDTGYLAFFVACMMGSFGGGMQGCRTTHRISEAAVAGAMLGLGLGLLGLRSVLSELKVNTKN